MNQAQAAAPRALLQREQGDVGKTKNPIADPTSYASPG